MITITNAVADDTACNNTDVATSLTSSPLSLLES
jgi:hypothetical protein